MMAVVRGLLAGALLFVGVWTEGQPADSDESQVQAEQVELTNSRPTASFTVSADTLVSSPPVLALSFPRVVNPANTPFAVFVYFSYRPGEKAGTALVRILLGNGSLYPADRPGGFRLRASAAFAKLKAAKATDVRLVVELERLHPAEPWTQVEVTVAAPQWRGENTAQGERVSKSLQESARTF
jgi:hypothetical protein